MIRLSQSKQISVELIRLLLQCMHCEYTMCVWECVRKRIVYIVCIRLITLTVELISLEESYGPL